MRDVTLRITLGALLLSAAWACSSSSENKVAGTGATGGSTGGAGGVAGASGGTTSTGATGGTSTGGAAGATGGSAGAAGAAGSSDAGINDASGDAPAEAGPPVVGKAGSVWCGDGAATCSVTTGGQCCYSNQGDAGPKYVCQGATGSCNDTTIKCDSNNDCGSGEVCCYQYTFFTQYAIASCQPTSNCKPSTSDGGVTIVKSATQLCDPTKVSPTECVYPASSSCQPTTLSALPAAYFGCK